MSVGTVDAQLSKIKRRKSVVTVSFLTASLLGKLFSNMLLLFVGIQPIQAQQLMLTWAIFTVYNTVKIVKIVTTVHKITARSQ